MSNNWDRWTTKPEYIELLNFLIEKTKDGKTTMRTKRLSEEFIEKSGAPQSMSGIGHRIRSLHPIIHKMDHIDTDTKVKLMFALMVPMDRDFLEKLKTEADIVLDTHQKIIEYSKKGGGLELKWACVKTPRVSSQEVNRRDMKILEFLVQKATGVDSPIALQTLVRQYRETTGSIESTQNLAKRFRLLEKQVIGSTTLDQPTKIRILFVTSASVPDDFLRVLRENALVEVDEKQRITKYRATDGSLELTGDHENARKRAEWETKRKNKKQQKSTDIDSDDDSDDNLEEEDRKDGINLDPTLLEDNKEEIGNLAPKKLGIEENNEFKNIETVTTKSGRVSKKRILQDPDDEEEDFLPTKISTTAQSNKNQKTDTPSSSDQIKTQARNSAEIPIKTEVEEVKPDKTHTSQFKFLEALKSLILFLDTPSLSRIKSRIHQKIIGGEFKLIPNNEILVAMEMCMVKMSNHSVTTPLKTEESCNLRDFFCYLKAAILSSKFDGIDGFLEKLKDNIELLYLQDKRIPVSKVESVLGAMLDLIDV